MAGSKKLNRSQPQLRAKRRLFAFVERVTHDEQAHDGHGGG
jgi:hypothetical protein